MTVYAVEQVASPELRIYEFPFFFFPICLDMDTGMDGLAISLFLCRV